MTATDRRATYAIDGGRSGRDRLRVLSAALRQSTDELLARVELAQASRVLDVGCGGGDVTSIIAVLAPNAAVTGIDFDPEIVRLAKDEAHLRGLHNVTYEVGDVNDMELPVEAFDVVYSRFLLSHVARPDLVLARMRSWTRPGGVIVVEDVDIPGAVCSPNLPAFDRTNALVAEAMRRRGGDPELGRRLSVLLHEAGLEHVETRAVQPGGLDGDAKQIQLLTLSATRRALAELELATSDETERLVAELAEFVNRPDTYVTTARVFQSIARRPAATIAVAPGSSRPTA